MPEADPIGILLGPKVIICDEQAEMGGSLLSEKTAMIDGLVADGWTAKALADLAARLNVTMMPRTTAFGSLAWTKFFAYWVLVKP